MSKKVSFTKVPFKKEEPIVKETEKLSQKAGDIVGCLGDYDPSDAFCKSMCSLKIRCLIEQDVVIQEEVLEDLIYVEEESQYLTMQ